ncbi:ABC transporter transmembrane domain-containing protein [Thiorhodovibrio frisius]|uniref:ABC transporter, permease/ATP-binding protein n=1 Tax=Thiorhodovibrio frisius TaxID=631362 RepID=H8YZX9_9GAMM|nr:ABC transporter transmembrane domain-containing protein [Thiorhodovibrio frisius]EIC22256.1 ABC transporter, permease/ATP-binding protein [Thiorhodovibrio frisius]WPL24551.1 Multidrug resistance ABC transporter ATP-binding/permease protein BmrA [Thiorhodovibrio frisius]
MHHQSSTSAPPDRPATRNPRALLRLLRFAKPYRLHLFGALLALLVAAGSVLTFGQVIRTVVDSGLSTGSLTALNQALVFFLAVVVLTAAAIVARSYLLNWIGERVVADIRQAVFERVLHLDIGYFESVRAGEVISRLTSDTALLQVVVGSTLAMVLRTSLLVIGGVLMLAITSPALTALVLLGVPLVVGPSWLLGSRVRKLSRASQDRVADIGAYIDEAVHGIRTVQAFNHQPIDNRRYADQVERAFRVAMQRSVSSALLSGIATLLTFGAIGAVLWVGGRQVLAGTLSGGDLSAFLFYAVLVAGSVGSLSDLLGQLLRGAGASERLMELLSLEPAVTSPAKPESLPEPARGAVRFEQVRFCYPSRPETPAADGLSLEIQPGERVALVGPSGAGKSTLFALLLRFYDPQQGAIRFDGVDLRHLDLRDLRGQIALVPQDPVIFGASAWENIRYGLDSASNEDVRRAAAAAHADVFLERLPQGFDTYLGERGVRLSGGERQRIAIARTILRNPALLLLDEATSALDAESERLVQDALEHLMQGRTSMVIAHRLATVRNANRILVLDQGRIVASGTHASLMREDGLYARLASLQFQDAVVSGV